MAGKGEKRRSEKHKNVNILKTKKMLLREIKIIFLKFLGLSYAGKEK